MYETDTIRVPRPICKEGGDEPFAVYEYLNLSGGGDDFSMVSSAQALLKDDIVFSAKKNT
jgi:hypothetical protein